MRKSLLCVLALSLASMLSYAEAADCVVELKSSTAQIIKQFQAAECREALRDCSRELRQYAGSVCEQRKPWPPQEPQQPPQYPQTPQVSGPMEVRHLTLTQQLQSRAFQNCELRQSGMYDHELLIDHVFFGRFDLYRDGRDLEQVLANFVRRGDCRYKRADILAIQLDPMLIQDSVAGLSRCRLAEEIRPQGRTGLFRLDVQFPSSSQVFLLPAQEAELREALAERIVSGQCLKRSSFELSLLRDPMLIQDFMNQQMTYCHLRSPNGQIHNLYIRGQLQGQFDLRRDETRLREILVDLIIQGRCVSKRPRF